jgi:prolyl oligopeptidase
MGWAPPRAVALTPYVEAHEEEEGERPPQAREPRHQAERRPGLTLLPPPPTPADGPVEHRHGWEVPDPYRWLEGAGPDVRRWVDAQNARTDHALRSLPARAAVHLALSRLLRAGSSFAPRVAGRRLFTLERWGAHDQAVLVVRPADAAGRARTLLDPAALEGDSTAAVDWYHPSPDGGLVAFGTSTGGDERSTLGVLDVASGELLADRIPHTRAASLAWEPDGSGFFYTRYPEPGTVPPGEDEYHRHVLHHRLGDDPATDPVAWDDLPDPTAWPTVELSDDGRWLLVHLSVGWSRTDVHLVDRHRDTRTVLIEGIEAQTALEVVGDQVLGVTTLGADRGRVVSAPLTTAWHDHWCTVVPESDAVIEAVAATPESLLVLTSSSAVSHLSRCAHDGSDLVEVALPEVGSVSGLVASHRRDEAFATFTSFTVPPTTLRWAPPPRATGATGATEATGATSGAWARAAAVDWSHLGVDDAEVGVAVGDHVVETHRYPADDGTEVALFLVRAAGTVPGPDTPCVLTGYGGFAIPMSPAWSPVIVDVCDRGGTYAVACIRGGSEEGEAWHRAGMREHKQRSFDDFAAAARWLVDRGLTSVDRLALRGGSNGGLLVGAVLTQHPEIARAVHAAVPLADMVRYPEMLIGRLWVPEYGDPDVPDELGWLLGYSPYHRVVDGTCYPAVLVTSAEGDSRVHPAHARKLAARLQAATACGDDHPVLLREESRAGHGQGKPVSAQADELADVLAFLYDQLGVDVEPAS